MPVQHTKDICKQKLAGDTLMMNFKVHSAEKLSPAKLCPQGFFSPPNTCYISVGILILNPISTLNTFRYQLIQYFQLFLWKLLTSHKYVECSDFMVRLSKVKKNSITDRYSTFPLHY